MDKAFTELKNSGAAAAEPWLRKAIEVAGDGTEFQALAIFNMGLVCYDLKKPKEAENHLAHAIEIIQDHLPQQDELYGMFIKTMIEFYEKEGRFAESKEYYLMEIQHTKNMFGERHPYVSNMICEYADVLMKLKEFPEAERALTRALDIMSGAKGPDHLQNANIHSNLARCYSALGRTEDAEWHNARAATLNSRRPRNADGRPNIEDKDTVEQQLD